MLLEVGGQDRILQETTVGGGTTVREFSIQSDSVLVSLFVDSVTSGDLSVVVYTLTDTGKEVDIMSFPTISAPTAELLLKKAAVSMSRVKIVATYTGVCSYEIYGRAISIGEASVRILGAVTGRASATVITTSPAVVVASSLEDRQGLVIKNNNTTGTLYLGFTLAEATTSNGYPLGPQESIGLDVQSGTAVYGVGTTTIDLRLLEAGS